MSVIKGFSSVITQAEKYDYKNLISDAYDTDSLSTKKQTAFFGPYRVEVQKIEPDSGVFFYSSEKPYHSISVKNTKRSGNYVKRFFKAIADFFVRLVDPASSCLISRAKMLENIVDKKINEQMKKNHADETKIANSLLAKHVNLYNNQLSNFLKEQSFQNSLDLFNNLTTMRESLLARNRRALLSENAIAAFDSSRAYRLIIAKFLIDNFPVESAQYDADSESSTLYESAAQIHASTAESLLRMRSSLNPINTNSRKDKTHEGFWATYYTTTRSRISHDNENAALLDTYIQKHKNYANTYEERGQFAQNDPFKLHFDPVQHSFYIETKGDYESIAMRPEYKDTSKELICGGFSKSAHIKKLVLK